MKYVFLVQDLENQALMEAESWREQQAQLEEQQALQNRAKQEMEAEVERYKQVRENDHFCHRCISPETSLIFLV